MNDREVNRIITEFMDTKITRFDNIHKTTGHCGYESELYTESLDALVPVWEKLGGFEIFISQFVFQFPAITGDKYQAFAMTIPRCGRAFSSSNPDIAKSCAYATAKAITYIKENNV